MSNEKPKGHEGAEETIQSPEDQTASSVRAGVDNISTPRKLPTDAPYEDLEAHIPEVSAMKGMDQRSDFHTLTLDEHTRQLGRNLESDPFIASHPQRELILLAGKLHDIGKASPDGQQVHPRDPEKRRYAGHEKESERMVRELLPRNFDLPEDSQEFVAKLAGLHASALSLVNNFQDNNEPKGKALKAYDKFMEKADEIPGDMDLVEKMRIIFALNRTDKGAGYNEKSDVNNEKVQAVMKKADAQISVLDEMEKALPSLVKAVIARREGDQTAGIVKVEGNYYYNKEAPNKKKKKKVEIPVELRPLGGILRDKMKPVAGVYQTLVDRKDNPGAMKGLVNGLLKGKLGLSDEQVDAVLATLK